MLLLKHYHGHYHVCALTNTVPFRPTLRSHVTRLSEAKSLSFVMGHATFWRQWQLIFRAFRPKILPKTAISKRFSSCHATWQRPKSCASPCGGHRSQAAKTWSKWYSKFWGKLFWSLLYPSNVMCYMHCMIVLAILSWTNGQYEAKICTLCSFRYCSVCALPNTQNFVASSFETYHSHQMWCVTFIAWWYWWWYPLQIGDILPKSACVTGGFPSQAILRNLIQALLIHTLYI